MEKNNDFLYSISVNYFHKFVNHYLETGSIKFQNSFDGISIELTELREVEIRPGENLLSKLFYEQIPTVLSMHKIFNYLQKFQKFTKI